MKIPKILHTSSNKSLTLLLDACGIFNRYCFCYIFNATSLHQINAVYKALCVVRNNYILSVVSVVSYLRIFIKPLKQQCHFITLAVNETKQFYQCLNYGPHVYTHRDISDAHIWI